MADRGKRPRPPRRRAEFRPVAELGERGGVTAFQDDVLGDDAYSEIASIAGVGECQSGFAAQLKGLALQNIRWRDQPMPARSETRYWLLLLAHLIWKNQCGDQSAIEELQRWREKADDGALPRLWVAMINLNLDLELINGSPSDWQDHEGEIIAQAAEAAAEQLPKGDYRDFSLWLTINELIGLYESATETDATVGMVPTGAISGRTATQARQSNSACGKMIAAFFAAIDPKGSVRPTGQLLATVDEPQIESPSPQPIPLFQLIA